MSNEKLEISYKFPTIKRKNSTFTSSKNTFLECKRPHSGCTTDSRFFAKKGTNEPQYIVKRILPKKIDLYGSTPEKRLKLFNFATIEFESELDKWNLVYPNFKGRIVFNQEFGPRLILPCLPGQELGWWLNHINFGDTITEAKIWLAVAYALRDLETKNLYQNDILEPNILVNKQDNGVFKAYVIDFGSVSAGFDCNVGRSSVCDRAQKLTGYSCKNYNEAIQNLNAYLASFNCRSECKA
ncbi:serine/threonine protein kinase [Legionella sainthelensi]|uniref:Protein kinase domain-containing protein n=1 Tax=Legionella sainthelensi TaxID=28087 RepID=A0A2H5FM64_9GAMM|nr:serine/threonine protein kinase [Legionella sainthelensi]AUH72590.1 hypothetical protein CAB17_11390 [Legionella sainthelensi]